MATRAEVVRAAAGRLQAAGCETARLDAEVLLADVLEVGRAALFADGGDEVQAADAARFDASMARRLSREPVAYIRGRRAFRTIELLVDGRVLIPRPETEHVVEAALDLPAGARVVDVGTGSGAIALALKAERPDLRVLATDTSPDAAAVAIANASRLGLDVEVRVGDLLDAVDGRVDCVLSNPPYVADTAELPPEIVRYEPPLALYGGSDGLGVIRRLIPRAAGAGATRAVLEVGAGQAAAVGDLMRASGYADVRIHRDLAGIERVVEGRR